MVTEIVKYNDSALSPIDRAVYLATTEKRIADYQMNELAQEINTAITWICRDVGYRLTDDADRQYLVIRTTEILKRYYPYFTLKDFRLAFELSVTGELDDYLPKNKDGQPDRSHYQNFSVEYVCKILNAYKAKRGNVMTGIQIEEKTGPTPEELRNAMALALSDFAMSFLNYKYRGEMSRLSIIGEMLCYNILNDAGLVGEDIEQEPAGEIIMAAVGRGRYAAQVERRRRAIERAFEGMAKDEIQITEIF